MPYGSIHALPDSVRSVLPVKAQEIYLAAFNTAYSETCKNRDDCEVCATKIAWSAVKKSYEKGEDGTWKKKSKTAATVCCRTGDCTRFRNRSESHAAILQLLNRQVGDTYFAVEPFEETVDSWNGVPIIFSDFPPMTDGTKSDHVDFEAFSTEILVSEIERVNGAVIGEVRNPGIENAGHPKLMGDLVFTEDTAKRLFKTEKITEEIYLRTAAWLEKANMLLQEGRLSHSTGFSCRSKDGALIGDPPLVPNHVLVFEEDPSNQPKDRGAVILNKNITEVNMTEEKGWLHQIQRKIEAVFTNRYAPGSDEERSMLLFNAVNERFGESHNGSLEKYGAFVDATFDEYVIVNTPNGAMYSVPYEISSGTVTLGSPTEVEVTYTPKPPQSQELAQATQTQDEVQDMDETMKKELDEAKALLASKDAEIQALKEDAAAQKTELDEFKKQQVNAAWEAEKKKLKAGLIHTAEDEAAMKKLFETDPYAYMNKAEYIGAPPTPESGDKFANKGEDEKDKKNDPVAVASELRKITGRR